MTRDDYTAPCIVGCCQRTADHGRWCCTPCTDLVRRQLADIPDYAAALDPRPSRGGDGTRQAPGFGSRSPARDDVIAATDPRSLPYALGPDDEDQAVRPVLATLVHLVTWIADERDQLDEPDTVLTDPTITSAAGWLRARVDWCARQQWIDELAADVADLYRQCRRLAGDPPPQSAAPCPDCGGPLWPRGDVDTFSLQCGECETAYNGLDLLRIAQEAAA